MTTWGEVARQAPELAAVVRRCFEVRRHATIATLRRDGTPRISGTEVEFAGDELCVGMMPGSRKALDLRRDGRTALHSPTIDPPEDDPAAWIGEAKIAGAAVEATDPAAATEALRFCFDVTEVVHTAVAASADHLVIRAWHPGRGLETHQRY